MMPRLKIMGTLIVVIAMFAMTTSAAQATFTSAAYPATITGAGTAEVIDMFGSSGKCEVSLIASMVLASDTMTAKPSLKGCKLFGLPATPNYTSCGWLFHKKSGSPVTTDLECSTAGDKIDFVIYTSAAHTTQICEAQMPAQNEKSGVTFTNEAGKIRMTGTIGGLTVKMVHRTSIACPVGPEESAGKYTIQAEGIVLSGSNGAISVD